MPDLNPAETLQQLQQLKGNGGDLEAHLAIVRISEPIFSPNANNDRRSSPSKRRSDVSVLDDPTPASLEADLTHYKVSA